MTSYFISNLLKINIIAENQKKVEKKNKNKVWNYK